MGYTLLISEKNEAARRLAEALDDRGRPEELELYGVPYYRSRAGGRELIVASAIGHLYSLAKSKSSAKSYPVFDVEWVPAHEVDKKASYTERRIRAIERLSKAASAFVSATDYDIEGELIGYTILRYACGEKENLAKRMKFSTLTSAELRASYQNLSETIDFKLAEAGETRHIVDFLWGINLSRALMKAVRSSGGGYVALSTGRVQTPTLKFLVEREMEIRDFSPKSYWGIRAEVVLNRRVYQVEFEEARIESRSRAEAIVSECGEMEGAVEEITRRNYLHNPPPPFNLSGLQSEAYRLFKHSPSRTLRIAEDLYLSAFISYPRTGSEKLPSTIGYREILSSLSRTGDYGQLAEELLSIDPLTPVEGKGTDLAHPAIYPTGAGQERPADPYHKRLYDLVVRRFMAAFARPALKESLTVTIRVGEHNFYLHGRRVLDQGWLRFYGSLTASDEILIPPVSEGQRVRFKRIEVEDKHTLPPPRYNPSSLLKMMEDQGIGTKATRSSIIDTLLKRGYVQGQAMQASDLGVSVVETLERYAPRIVSVDFTRELEREMEQIEEGRLRRDTVLADSIARLDSILEEMSSKELDVGRSLSEALRKLKSAERIIGPCPKCDSGRLIIVVSKASGKRFAGCTNWSRGECTASFPLPQNPYLVSPTKKACPACGWSLVSVKSKGRRAWSLCLNPLCPRKSSVKSS